MPIKKSLRFFYPIDWKELSREIRFGRAKGKCEACKRPHGKLIVQVDGYWWDADAGLWRDERGRRRAVFPALDRIKMKTIWLSTAHLDNNPGNNTWKNLKALCPRCHLAQDKQHHLAQRRITYTLRRAKRRSMNAIRDLFD